MVTCFNTSILAKKKIIELFGITQLENEFTRTYLKRFNEKMIKVIDLIKPLYPSPYINEGEAKYKNPIRVSEASMLCHTHFIVDKHLERFLKRGCLPKQNRSPKQNNNPNRSKKKPFRECLDTVIISTDIFNHGVYQILVHNNSAINIISAKVMVQIGILCSNLTQIKLFFIGIECLSVPIKCDLELFIVLGSFTSTKMTFSTSNQCHHKYSIFGFKVLNSKG
ncbi:hypothetical protein SADUNF_Sadunf10G0032000 [Salix dunnii]|uniref:Uncharacterized protein n=1 Tax=Salix dunnii TaxID=1413687 RepID=A0A835JNH0_9ROSI|nr:hypothetical protein SADUNF_Sadunf10G0032000 [Salix dunnii]